MQRPDSYDVQWLVGGNYVNQVALTADSVSEPIQIATFRSWSFNQYWTGAPIGTLNVQVCNAHNKNNLILPGEITPWVIIPDLSTALSASPLMAIQIQELNAFGWVRLAYTFTSGGVGATLGALFQGVTT